MIVLPFQFKEPVSKLDVSGVIIKDLYECNVSSEFWVSQSVCLTCYSEV